jgi:hypothetical protein
VDESWKCESADSRNHDNRTDHELAPFAIVNTDGARNIQQVHSAVFKIFDDELLPVGVVRD